MAYYRDLADLVFHHLQLPTHDLSALEKNIYIRMVVYDIQIYQTVNSLYLHTNAPATTTG